MRKSRIVRSQGFSADIKKREDGKISRIYEPKSNPSRGSKIFWQYENNIMLLHVPSADVYKGNFTLKPYKKERKKMIWGQLSLARIDNL